MKEWVLVAREGSTGGWGMSPCVDCPGVCPGAVQGAAQVGAGARGAGGRQGWARRGVECVAMHPAPPCVLVTVERGRRRGACAGGAQGQHGRVWCGFGWVACRHSCRAFMCALASWTAGIGVELLR